MSEIPFHFKGILPAEGAGTAGEASPLSPPAIGPSGEDSFLHVLKDSIEKVNAVQTDADRAIQDFSTGENGVTLHQTMVAMAQADVSFQLMMQVRDRIVRAYQEVMNMPM